MIHIYTLTLSLTLTLWPLSMAHLDMYFVYMLLDDIDDMYESRFTCCRRHETVIERDGEGESEQKRYMAICLEKCVTR